MENKALITAFRRFGFAAAGALLAAASLVPETWLSLVFGWATALLLVALVRHSRRLAWAMYLMGLVFHGIAFYWVPYTIQYFGGFPELVSLLLYALFCLISSIQFAFCGWMTTRLRRYGTVLSLLALPIAWAVSEFIVPRMFPWAIAHSQISWSSFAALAQFSGVSVLGFLMFWWAEAVFQLLCVGRKTQGFLVVSGLSAACLLGVGYLSRDIVAQEMEQAPAIKIGIIQGNLDAKQKGDLKSFDTNVERYRVLSEQAVAAGADLLIWPEAVVTKWISESKKSVRGSKADPYPNQQVPLLYGALTYRERSSDQIELFRERGMSRDELRNAQFMKFNSAVGITPTGDLVGVYHKKVLMPFGEYIPFGDRFPQLYELSPHTGRLDEGDRVEPIVFAEVSANGEQREFRAGALICYEDLVPRLAREAVQHGANILVNLTNDAWYGDSAAPYQHQLLAAWRAIETRRYLIRATNTGFTAIVNPLGERVNSLPIFTKGQITHEVKLLESTSPYTRIGDWPCWLLSVLAVLLCLVPRTKQNS